MRRYQTIVAVTDDISKEPTIIIVHADSSMGFIPYDPADMISCNFM